MKLKIHSYFFGHAFLCPCYLMTTFYYLSHLCFFSPFQPQRKIYLSHSCFFLSLSSSMQNPQFLLLVSLKSSLNWPKIQNDLLLQNNQIVKWGNFVTGIKIFTWNNLMISIVLIWYLPIANLLLFLPVLTYLRSFFCKWFKLC